MKDSVIILSGGMDSVTLLYDQQERIALAVSFDYGSNHNAREIPFARLHCERLGIEHLVIPLKFMVAVGLAESRGLKHVMMANHGGDHTIYPDCRPEFVSAMSEAARTGTFPGITLLCPFTHLTKTQIAARGSELGINYAETWSCYKGGEKHCGRCGTCVERMEALREAGIADPTEYETI